MTTDLTFLTNEEGRTLHERFTVLIKNTRFFDCLVGYFYTSGFHSMYKSLETTEKIRILVGISTDATTVNLIYKAKEEPTVPPSHKEAKEAYAKQVESEMEHSPDTRDVEEGVHKFVEWLRSGKLEIRAYPAQNIHAKIYIMTFKEGGADDGRVITGSSNFTKSGLLENLEFNVELKNRSDYEFALNKFNELWKNSVDVSEKYMETIKTRTWLNDTITPYELYLKFLYEYLKEKINLDKDEMYKNIVPPEFMNLQYQRDAVSDAKAKLEEYGGVFISDVVGLGKTYVSAMLANQLDGGTLVIAPPVLLDRDNPGSWPNVFFQFGVRQAHFESLGKLDKIIQEGTDRYKNIIIDESHRFRTEQTEMYEQLFQICRNKRVILVSATPLNNSPRDILSQIKLFQEVHKSTLPSPQVRDLERYFNGLQTRLRGLDRQQDSAEYLRIVKENSENIRKNVLQYLMVRRTRSNIAKYYKKDLERQKLRFPEVSDPEAAFYTFDAELDRIFTKTLELIIKKFSYSRYAPLLDLKEGIDQPTEISQKNMIKFMRILLLKRLESSFFAFKKSIERFAYSYRRFIEEFHKGKVYVSKKYTSKIFDLLDRDDMEAIQTLIAQGDAHEFKSSDFNPELIKHLEADLKTLTEIQDMWKDIDRDPKLEKFIQMLKTDNTLKKNKLIVFTESMETACYLEEKLKPILDNKVISYSSHSDEDVRRKIISNFDAKARNKSDEYRVLVSTEVLSEGVNLHRSNVVINYDIPWNPTRMMQRVGRINRVDTAFDRIYTYNFFPAGQINENIKLKEAAEAKIKAFIEMLGNDARLLTDEDIKSFDLFNQLNSKKAIVGGDEEEEDADLKYLTFLREIRDNKKDLFERVKRLPKKARSAKKSQIKSSSAITFFRKNKLRKIYRTDGNIVEEVDFAKAAEILKAVSETKRELIAPDFYPMLEKNKKEFDAVFARGDEPVLSGGRSSDAKLGKIIRAIHKSKEFTDEDEDYLSNVLDLIRDGAIAKATTKRLVIEIGNEDVPLKILARIKAGIPDELFKRTFVRSGADSGGPKEVILSEYLVKSD